MNRTFIFSAIAAAVIIGGLYYIHCSQAAQPDSVRDSLAQPQLNATDAGLYGALYASGHGSWIPGGAVNITDPDPADLDGSYTIQMN